MKNGTCWLDDEGRPIQAHGGMIARFDGLWYWYGENKDADLLACTVRKNNGAADLLIGMTAVAACTNMNFNGFVKLGGSAFLDKLDGIHRIVQCGTIDSFSGF